MKAYNVVFECPKGGHNINLQRKLALPSLSITEATTMFGNSEISCPDEACGWHGKVSTAKVIQVTPFQLDTCSSQLLASPESFC